MTRGGRDKNRDGPERKCIVTGEVNGTVVMIRFVLGPDDEVVADIAGRLPGRGMWVGASRATLERAISKKAFARAARRPVKVPESLADSVETMLARRVVELISLARKAGKAVAGYEKVKGWLATGEGRILLQAHDGSARGRTKLRPPDGTGSLIEVLSASELGLAFGRENVIHGALAGGGLTMRVVEEAARLAAMREKHGGDRPAWKGTTSI